MAFPSLQFGAVSGIISRQAAGPMKTWSILTALVIAVVTVLNLVQAVRHVPPAPVDVTGRPPGNVVLRQELRFATLRRALETRGVRGTIGYVGDLAPPQMAADHRSMEDYFTAQFVLVPWVLDPNPGSCRWAVTNLRAQPVVGRTTVDFQVVEDFGGGVALLRKGVP